jgi:hypothetical protein
MPWIVEYFCNHRHAENASEPGVSLFFMHWTSLKAKRIKYAHADKFLVPAMPKHVKLLVTS